MNNVESQPMSYRTTTVRRIASAGRALPAAAFEIKRSWLTRAIHLVLLLLVLHQLIGSQFIERPLPGDTPAWPYLLHEYTGLAGLVVVTTFWLWALVRRGETRVGRLLPWFSPTRIRDVIADLIAQFRQLMGGKFPEASDGAFASAVHGLGLLTVSAMALSGAIFFFAAGTPVAHVALDLHKLMANLMWAYLIGHAGIAILHQMFGDKIISRMFWGGHSSHRGR